MQTSLLTHLYVPPPRGPGKVLEPLRKVQKKKSPPHPEEKVKQVHRFAELREELLAGIEVKSIGLCIRTDPLTRFFGGKSDLTKFTLSERKRVVEKELLRGLESNCKVEVDELRGDYVRQLRCITCESSFSFFQTVWNLVSQKECGNGWILHALQGVDLQKVIEYISKDLHNKNTQIANIVIDYIWKQLNKNQNTRPVNTLS